MLFRKQRTVRTPSGTCCGTVGCCQSLPQQEDECVAGAADMESELNVSLPKTRSFEPGCCPTTMDLCNSFFVTFMWFVTSSLCSQTDHSSIGKSAVSKTRTGIETIFVVSGGK